MPLVGLSAEVTALWRHARREQEVGRRELLTNDARECAREFAWLEMRNALRREILFNGRNVDACAARSFLDSTEFSGNIAPIRMHEIVVEMATLRTVVRGSSE